MDLKIGTKFKNGEYWISDIEEHSYWLTFKDGSCNRYDKDYIHRLIEDGLEPMDKWKKIIERVLND